MSRTGKIARLPHQIRLDLNRRLHDGRPAQEILPWLNQLPETQQLLAAHFGSSPISEQNLSDWRRGGYADWLALEEAAALPVPPVDPGHPFAASASSGESPADLLSTQLALHLSRCLDAAGRDGYDTPKKRAEILRIVAAVTKLRQSDLARARFRLAQQKRTPAPTAQPTATGSLPTPSAAAAPVLRPPSAADPLACLPLAERPPLGTPEHKALVLSLGDLAVYLKRLPTTEEARMVAAALFDEAPAQS